HRGRVARAAMTGGCWTRGATRPTGSRWSLRATGTLTGGRLRLAKGSLGRVVRDQYAADLSIPLQATYRVGCRAPGRRLRTQLPVTERLAGLSMLSHGQVGAEPFVKAFEHSLDEGCRTFSLCVADRTAAAGGLECVGSSMRCRAVSNHQHVSVLRRVPKCVAGDLPGEGLYADFRVPAVYDVCRSGSSGLH